MYRSLAPHADAVTDVLFEVDRAGRVVSMTEACAHLFGTTPAEALGHSGDARVLPESRPAVAAAVARLVRGETSVESLDVPVRDGAGRRRWLDCRFHASVVAPDGRVERVLVAAHDITSHVDGRSAAARQADRLSLLATLTAGDDTLEALATRALTLTAHLLGLETGVLSRIEGDRYTIVACHAPGPGVGVGSVLPLATTYCSLALQHDGPLVIEHMGASPYADRTCYVDARPEGYIGVPVRSEGAVWGTLCFSSARPLAGPPSPDDLDFVRVVALWLGGLVDRFRQRDALAVQSEQLRAVVTQAPVVLYAFDADGVVTLHIGRAAEEAERHTPTVGRSLFDLYADHPDIVERTRRVLGGEATEWTTEIHGTHYEVHTSPTFDATGRVVGGIGVGVDVTAHVLADAQVREAEQRYRTLSAATFEAILFSENGVVIEANQQAARLFGYASLLDVIGRDAQVFVTPGSLARVRQMIEENRHETYEVQCVRADGSTFWAEVQGRATQLRGRPVRLTAIRDVSKRKATEEQTRFQASVLAHVSDAVVAVDLDGHITYWNGGAERLHGISGADALGRPFDAVVHYRLPDAAPDAVPDDASAEPPGGALPPPGHTSDLWYTTPEGVARAVSVSVSDLEDADGQPAGVLAVARDVTEARAMAARLRHEALHDGLTGLPNRTFFRQRVDAARAAGQPFGVLFVDLDRFKTVNDTLGHAAGDRLLTVVADRMRAVAEGREGVCVSRFGGDELAMLVPGRPAEARRLARTLLRALEAPVRLGGHDLMPTASIGVVAEALPYADADALLRDADTAMYEAKHAGRGRATVFRPAMHEAAARRFGLEHTLREALPNGQLRLEMQPIVDLATGAVAGFESLVRWQHPVHGRLTPDHFVPLAEELGLVAEIDRWMLAETCRQAGAWHESPGLLMLSVNCSDQTFLSDGLAAWASQTAVAAGLDPSRLALELTERALVETLAAQGVLETVREHGLQLCIDDFGAGYSSLGLLHALPVDGLKIDRSFVGALATSRSARAVVRAVAGLSDELGMRIVAEGIETREQLAALRAAGCRLGQGYLFSRPVPPDDARRLIASRPWQPLFD